MSEISEGCVGGMQQILLKNYENSTSNQLPGCSLYLHFLPYNSILTMNECMLRAYLFPKHLFYNVFMLPSHITEVHTLCL